MTKALVPLALALALTLALGCGADDSSTATDDAISDHMVARGYPHGPLRLRRPESRHDAG